MQKVHPNAIVAPLPGALRPSSEVQVLTVWKKSLMFNCKGFTVFDSNGNLMFRVDNYFSTNRAHIILMDAAGNPLLTVRRKKLALADSWAVFNGETEVNPLCTVKKNVNFLNSKLLAQVSHGCKSKRALYQIEGSYTQRCCRVYDDKRRVMTEIKRKEPVGGVSFDVDVFRLVVQPDMDPAVAMALVILLEQMFGSRS